jgi:uncharacterized protein (TIGR02453 family)
MTPAKKEEEHFRPGLFAFEKELARNNRRDWFEKNKSRYEDEVKDPSLRFISDFGPHLRKISPHFLAIPKTVGGSLFRIYRDVRFSKDKSPYKTHVGIHFRHKAYRDAHAPGFYLHLEPAQCFVGMGIWHPDGPTLKKIRDAIVANPAAWKRASRGKKFSSRFDLAGDSLKRPPRGYDPEHPLIDDLRRKDFIAVANLSQKQVTSAGFLGEFVDLCKAGSPLVKYLCAATGVTF